MNKTAPAAAVGMHKRLNGSFPSGLAEISKMRFMKIFLVIVGKVAAK